jgi:RNA polymerase sigma-70 factor (ECF subfamily)
MSANPAPKFDQDVLLQLMQKIATDRDRQAFAQLFDLLAPQIKAYSLSREPGANLVADELVQEVLIRVWQKAETYNPAKAKVSTWVFTLARNCRVDYLRRNGRYASDIDPEDVFLELEDQAAGPFETTQQQRAASKLHQGLEQLPAEQSMVLSKVYMEGKTHQEAAAELQLPLGTIKSRIRLALQKLHIALKT